MTETAVPRWTGDMSVGSCMRRKCVQGPSSRHAAAGLDGAKKVQMKEANRARLHAVEEQVKE